MNMPTDIPVRVLRVRPEHARSRWVKSQFRHEGLRYDLVPSWAKELYCDEGEEGRRVPHRKYHNQPGNHHPECFAMAIVERRENAIEPERWERVDGGESDPPPWLTGPHECLYECYRLLEEPAQRPAPGDLHSYGNTILDAAIEVATGESFTTMVLGIQSRTRQDASAIHLGDIDLIAMPSAGGVPRFIEVKGTGDRMKGRLKPEKQVNSLALLRKLGFEVELWYTLPGGEQAERDLPPVDPRLARMTFERPAIRVRPNIDWHELRQSAAEPIPRSTRWSPCECARKGWAPCLAAP